MAILLGFLIGDALGRIGLWRAIAVLAFWIALTAVAYRLAAANISPAAGFVAAVIAPLGMLVWTLWDPATSRFRLWLIDGIYLWARLAMWVSLVLLAWGLIEFDFRIAVTLAHVWPVMLVGAVAWLIQRGVLVLLKRSHDAAGERSVVCD